jgi:invasion protein IalB
MRMFSILLASLSLVAAAPAPQKPPAHPAKPPAAAQAPAPKSIGTFGDWQAATHVEAGQTVCYAFTRAQSSAPVQPGRGDVVLSVTERSSGRDAVAISAGFTYAANAAVNVQIDQTPLDDFYTAQRSAFARDGKAAVAAFRKGSAAIAKSPGPKNAPVTDTFSLKGFEAAYAMINKTCPAK